MCDTLYISSLYSSRYISTSSFRFSTGVCVYAGGRSSLRARYHELGHASCMHAIRARAAPSVGQSLVCAIYTESFDSPMYVYIYTSIHTHRGYLYSREERHRQSENECICVAVFKLKLHLIWTRHHYSAHIDSSGVYECRE